MRRILLLTLIIAQSAFGQSLKKSNSVTNNGHTKTNQTGLTCNNWLNLPSYQSYVTLGDLDIPGNTVTIEAVFVRTAPYSGGYNWAGDLVSKHIDPNDVNYLLRPNNAEITTSAGFFITPPICEIELNRTYHAALVYDGSTLKFYRNGFLMSQVPATGNLIQNNHPARIGLYAGTAHNTNLIGQINEVRIWNVARTQDQIRTYLNTSLPSPASQPGLLAYYTFENLLNKQGNPAWNGSIFGSAQINQTNSNCILTVDSCRLNACTTNNDFSFNINPCNPLNISFYSNATGYNNIRWSFGDGNTANNNASPQNTYSSQGNYTVTMITDYPACSDTMEKNISVLVQQSNQIITTNDTTICFGNSKQLNSIAGISSCWQPATYLSATNVPNPVTTTPHSITYFLNSVVSGNNLIINGDFSQGNTGFTSDYLYSPSSGINAGVYNVGSIITVWHPNMSACNDHTTGNGNMLMVNGSTDLNVKVWSQSVPVAPNTNYNFSTWLQHITTINPARLQFSINGNIIGTIFQANNISCIWEQFNAIWNSGTNTTAVISIVNQNSLFSGNDFALDDISFSPIYVRRDSVRITVDTPSIIATRNANICLGDSVHLNATGSTLYNWSPATGLNNPNIANPISTPTESTTYIVSGINSNGCIASDSVKVSVRIPVSAEINPPGKICKESSIQLTATGGDIYSWSPSTYLNNSFIPNPVASPSVTSTYTVTITDTLCNNSSTLSTIVTVLPLPVIRANKSNDIDCAISQSQLTASGATQYTWTPATTLDNPFSSSPVATPIVTTQYIVTGTDADGCTNSDSIQVLVNATNKGGYIMPTAFTPNNDGLNDCYGIKYWGIIQELEFSIYNRWGERIFFTRNPRDCWDGRYKGIPQDPAIFVYMIKAKTTCESYVFRKGTFALIR